MKKEMFEVTKCESPLLLFADTGNFLFDHLTIADFIFYEYCYYFDKLFGDIAKKNHQYIQFAYKNFFERT